MNIPMTRCSRFFFALMLALWLQALPVRSAVTIVSGLATAGADITSGSSISSPPTGAISPDVFYDSRSLITTPNDPAGLTAEGWASVNWQTGANRLQASGASTQGYNGAIGANGYIYGFGHASFAAGFQIDQTCAYTNRTPSPSIKGLRGSYGFLPARDSNNNQVTYAVSGYTYGNSGGFSMDVTFSAATAAQNSLLNGAISAPQIIPSSIPNHPYFIKIAFIPQDGETIEQAAQTLGVASLNFVNTIVAIPPSWQISDNGQVVASNGQLPADGLPDPLPHAASGSGRLYAAPALGMTAQPVKYVAGKGDDTAGAYWDVSYATSATPNDARPSAWELDFVDSPHKPPGFFAQGGYQAFRTQLVGLNQNGDIIAYFGAPVYWYTSQATEGTMVIGDSTTPDDPDIGTIYSGATIIGSVPLEINWPGPAPIPYGSSLSSNQLNASANVPGWFTYTPTNGSVLRVGTNVLSAVFTPQNRADYSPMTNSVLLIVSPAELRVTASNARRAYGETNPVFTGSLTGLRNGENIGAVYTCSATTTSPNGTYPIRPTLVDPDGLATNYSVVYINGTLTIAPPLLNLVTNPSFELMRAGWNFFGNAGVTPAPRTGTYAAFVNISTGAVTQTISTVPGDLYSVSFWLSANGYSSPGALITASLGGVVGFSNVYPAGAFSYQQHTFTVAASGTNSAFSFAGSMSGGTFFLDDVSVVDLGTLTNGIVITSQPASDSIAMGKSGSFQVEAQSALPLAYQWCFERTNLIQNATNNALVIPSASAADAGEYNVIITSSLGSVASAIVTLSLLDSPIAFSTTGALLTNGVFRVPVGGLTGQGNIVIEASSDLVQWSPVFTNRSAFGSFDFCDTNAANYPFRFYRARVETPGN